MIDMWMIGYVVCWIAVILLSYTGLMMACMAKVEPVLSKAGWVVLAVMGWFAYCLVRMV